MSEQNNAQNAPLFRMQKMYVKDLSFESPNAPGIFLEQGQDRKVDFNLELRNTKVDDDHWEVSLVITAKMLDKSSEDDEKVIFVIELEHAGIFTLKNIPAEHLERVLAIDCPLMLFPFTRQVVSQVSLEGGFMPFLMEPINFMALYENVKRQQGEKTQQ